MYVGSIQLGSYRLASSPEQMLRQIFKQAKTFTLHNPHPPTNHDTFAPPQTLNFCSGNSIDKYAVN
jgi:hypothetical protein